MVKINMNNCRRGPKVTGVSSKQTKDEKAKLRQLGQPRVSFCLHAPLLD